MTFAFHHPSYYKKLKQNSGSSSKNDVSEDLTPPTMETKVGQVGSLISTHTNHEAMIHPKHKKQIDKWIDSGLKEEVLNLKTLSPAEIKETKKEKPKNNTKKVETKK